ncbi:LysR family transcriptional regulator [Granulosicoccus sp.]|nr:LysR family transcriptional regulator [Granulosicoccus sp.]MDB4224511.1 LysR family transcriptional regulator [Granulosicoccus sp.]
MRIIASLADLKLITRVSEALNVTQPAISKQITELERIVGDPLVTRDRNRLHLTPIGIRLAKHAKEVLSQLDRAAFDIEAMASGVSGSVSIGVVSSVAPTLLPGTIALFKNNTPDVLVSVTEGHFVGLYPSLEVGELDLLIARIWHPQELPGIIQKTLYSEPLVVVVGRSNPLSRKNDLTWSDVVNFPWIMPQSNSVARRAVDALFAQNGLSPPRNMISSLSVTLNLEIFAAMPAIGLLPKSLAQTYAGRGEIVILPLDTQGFLSETRCFIREGQTDANGALTLFMKCLEQTIEDIKTIPFS